MRSGGLWRAVALAVVFAVLSGGPAAGEFEIGGPAPQWPVLGAGDDGRFVVVWEVDREVRLRRFDASGSPDGPEVLVGLGWAVRHASPDVAMLPGGEFVVVWHGAEKRGRRPAILMQRFASDGERLGSAVQVNDRPLEIDPRDEPPSFFSSPVVSAGARGELVVVWRVFPSDLPELGRVVARRLGPGGGPLGGSFRLSDGTALRTERRPDVAHTPDGGFVVLWQEDQEERVRLRRFGPDGGTRGEVMTLSSTPARYPALAVDREGRIIAVWQRNVDPDPKRYTCRLVVRELGPEAKPERPLPIGDQDAVSPCMPRVAALPSGGYVVAWQQANEAWVQSIPATGVPGKPLRLGSWLVEARSKPDVAVGGSGMVIAAWVTWRPSWPRSFGEVIDGERLRLGDPLTPLGGEGTGPGVPEQVRLAAAELQAADADRRRAAAEHLGRLKGAAAGAVPALVERLRNDPSDQVRLGAAHGLGWMASRGSLAVPALVDAVNDDVSAVVRGAAVRGLGAFPDEPAARAALVAILSARSADLRSTAAIALGEMGEKARPAGEALLRLLEREPEAGVRRYAVYAIAEIGPALQATAQDHLITTFLEDPDADVREAAVKALLVLEADRGDLPTILAEALASPDHARYRGIVAAALILSDPAGAEPHVAALQEVLATASEPVQRVAIARAIGRLGERGVAALPVLLEALGDGDEWVRGVAAMSIGHLGPAATAAIPALVRASRQRTDWNLRGNARSALYEITGGDPASMQGRD